MGVVEGWGGVGRGEGGKEEGGGLGGGGAGVGEVMIDRAVPGLYLGGHLTVIGRHQYQYLCQEGRDVGKYPKFRKYHFSLEKFRALGCFYYTCFTNIQQKTKFFIEDTFFLSPHS